MKACVDPVIPLARELKLDRGTAALQHLLLVRRHGLRCRVFRSELIRTRRNERVYANALLLLASVVGLLLLLLLRLVAALA